MHVHLIRTLYISPQRQIKFNMPASRYTLWHRLQITQISVTFASEHRQYTIPTKFATLISQLNLPHPIWDMQHVSTHNNKPYYRHNTSIRIVFFSFPILLPQILCNRFAIKLSAEHIQRSNTCIHTFLYIHTCTYTQLVE